MSISPAELNDKPIWFSTCLSFFCFGLPFLLLLLVIISTIGDHNGGFGSDERLWVNMVALIYVLLIGIMIGFPHTFLAAALFWVLAKSYLSLFRKKALGLTISAVFGAAGAMVGATTHLFVSRAGRAEPHWMPMLYFFCLSALTGAICGLLVNRASKVKKIDVVVINRS